MAHRLVWAPGMVSVGLGEVVEAPFETHDGNGEVGQAGEISRPVAGMNAATVLVIGDVAHVMETIFDAPMPSHELEHAFGAGLLQGQGGQPMDGLVLHDAGLAVLSFALDAKRHPAMGELAALGFGAQVQDPATRKRPVEMFDEERDRLQRLPELVYDLGSVHTVRASNRFRITFETNRYSVPAEYASATLTLKSYPDHPRVLLEQRR